MTTTDELFDAEEKIMQTVRKSVDDLPILARLEFAANLVFDNGGLKDDAGRIPGLVIAHEVITDVINVLAKHPSSAQLRTPEP
jgi:hypothetical protein